VAVHPYHDGEARIVPSHRRQEFQLLCYLKANIKDRQYLNLGEFWTESSLAGVTKILRNKSKRKSR